MQLRPAMSSGGAATSLTAALMILGILGFTSTTLKESTFPTLSRKSCGRLLSCLGDAARVIINASVPFHATDLPGKSRSAPVSAKTAIEP